MKEYPKILGPYGMPHGSGIAFYKYDGSNLRFEWSRKRGWYKFGTRRMMIDQNDKEYGEGVRLFLSKYGDALEKVFLTKYERYTKEGAMAFAEFFGPHSFAGKHDATFLGVESNDPKDIVLFDVNINKKGFVAPHEFVKNFGHLHIPDIIYQGDITEQFVSDVREGKYPVVEGVVCKGGEGHGLWMRKIKTWAYNKRLREVFGVGWKDFWE